MMNISIVVDSIACPTKEQKKLYELEIVPINISYEGKIYRDFIDLSPSLAYQFLEEKPEDWATAAPSPGDFLSVFHKLRKEGVKKIICLTMSQKLSATFNSARLAKESAKNELPDVRIEVIDTKTAAGGENLLCQWLGEKIKSGQSIDEIIPSLEKLREKVKVFIVLETIRYIYRSGRVPEVASKLGAILHLRPILKISNGKVSFVGAAATREKSIGKTLKILKQNWNRSLPEICLMHADCLSEAEELKNKIKNLLPSDQPFVTDFSPIMGYACGRGSLLIAFFVN